MKASFLLLVTVVAFSSSKDEFPRPPGDRCVRTTPMPTPTMGDLVQNLLATLPINDMMDTINYAIVTDSEVRMFLQYFRGSTVKTLVKKITEIRELPTTLHEFCEETYFDVYFYVNLILDALELEPINPSQDMQVHSRSTLSFGVQGLLNDLLNMIDKIEFGLALSGFFNNEYVELFREIVGSPNFKLVLYEAGSYREMQDALEHIRSYGIDIDYYIEAAKSYFGID